MVGSGHPAHDTRAARPDLARDAMGNAARSRAGSPTRVCPLVSKARAHLQRCPGPCPPRTLDLADFRRLTGSPRRAETLSPRAQPPLARRLPTALTCKAKLRAATLALILSSACRFEGLQRQNTTTGCRRLLLKSPKR